MNEDYLDKIEQINTDYINLLYSKEYQAGVAALAKKTNKKNPIERFFGYVDRLKIRKILSEINHAERDNGYTVDDSLLAGLKHKKIVVYTCITGGYDALENPLIKVGGVDYVAYVDKITDAARKSEWDIKPLPTNVATLNNDILANRYIKFHPFQLFAKKYDYSIYVDGNVRPVGDVRKMILAINEKTGLALHRHQYRDSIYSEAEACRIFKKGNYKSIREQVEKYRGMGFPDNFGLYECNAIVVDLHSQAAETILNDWWEEFNNSDAMRDQIILPYIIWKNGKGFDDVGSLGNNIYKNPLLRIEKHH